MSEYRKAIVLGLGLSGDAAARLLLAEGADVTVLDASDKDELKVRANVLEKKGARVLLGEDKVPKENFDICIVSPGIKSSDALVLDAQTAGIEVLSELELGASRCKSPMIGITGTNGKSTLTKLCAEALRCGGLSAMECGNYGNALCDVVIEGEGDWNVVEVSSFQLEQVKNFRPEIGVLLNVQPDHIDRHGSMEEYMNVKSKLFRRMQSSDTGIVMASCLSDVMKVSMGRNKWVSFGRGGSVDYKYADGVVFCTQDGQDTEISVKGSPFENDIMGLTAAAAVGVVSACGLDLKLVEKAAAEFKILPHRMSLVGKINGVSFIDDSKATNLAALDAGIKMCDGPVRLIAGGRLKEKNLDRAKELLEKGVRKVYLIGESAPLMLDAWRDSVSCCDCGGLEAAVKMAWNDAGDGDIVLLSPGCASFDQFENFKDRGNKFIEIVEKLGVYENRTNDKE